MLTKNVREVLEKATQSSRSFGGSENINDLQQELQSIKVASSRFFYVAGIMCVLIFIIIIYLILKYQSDMTYLTAVYSIGGVSLAGLVTLMIRLGKTYSESNLTLALVSKLPIDDILPVLRTLLEKDNSGGTLDSKISQ